MFWRGGYERAPRVEKVSPAVVSVRVKGNIQPVSSSEDNLPFGGQGFDNLPDNHPLKRFFREFGGPDASPGMPRQNDQRRMQRPRPISQGQRR